jgi:hypothetical protein
MREKVFIPYLLELGFEEKITKTTNEKYDIVTKKYQKKGLAEDTQDTQGTNDVDDAPDAGEMPTNEAPKAKTPKAKSQPSVDTGAASDDGTDLPF